MGSEADLIRQVDHYWNLTSDRPASGIQDYGFAKVLAAARLMRTQFADVLTDPDETIEVYGSFVNGKFARSDIDINLSPKLGELYKSTFGISADAIRRARLWDEEIDENKAPLNSNYYQPSGGPKTPRQLALINALSTIEGKLGRLLGIEPTKLFNISSRAGGDDYRKLNLIQTLGIKISRDGIEVEVFLNEPGNFGVRPIPL